MDRKRIHDEVIEILCHKLPQLPLPTEEPLFNYDTQKVMPDVTDNELDIAEVTMDLEDAFGVVMELEPGCEELNTIGAVTDYIKTLLDAKEASEA